MADTRVAYKNAAVKSCVDIWSEGNFAHMMAKEIVTGSNEKALDILRANGYNGPFDDDGFASLRSVTDFYGVSTHYMTGIRHRYHISKVSAPMDVRHPYGMEPEFSARMILAMACVMYAGRNIPADSNVSKVFLSLNGTTYYVRAKHAMDARKIAGIMSDDETVKVTNDGEIMLSVPALMKLLALVGNNTAS